MNDTTTTETTETDQTTPAAPTSRWRTFATMVANASAGDTLTYAVLEDALNAVGNRQVISITVAAATKRLSEAGWTVEFENVRGEGYKVLTNDAPQGWNPGDEVAPTTRTYTRRAPVQTDSVAGAMGALVGMVRVLNETVRAADLRIKVLEAKVSDLEATRKAETNAMLRSVEGLTAQFAK